ncbi:hypothetical protein GCM10010399_44670 [Dactylosporangium fulvum]|uniref:MEDS domain-containing protein n=1 Tax=Dactylosporangium fulvum TaxID=53359 RepID=A0ABY5WAA4_9ACTN|nr:MEDS domain-containing protein [Dactylosporangium fulvum]UWP86149.1 MEDS domain-containing protein [Dactylosporangium fulvum]
MDSWRIGDHLSATYAADDDCRDLMVGFVRRGVAAGHRVVVLLDTYSFELARALTAAVPDAAIGQFTALRFGAGFGGPGADGTPFGVADLVAGLTALYEQALAAGYDALCVAGEMVWAQRAGFTAADLLAYEAQVNRSVGVGRAAALCAYDRRRFGADLLTRIGVLHPGPLLRFTLGGWGAHLRLSGELDASNAGALPAILSLVAGADSVVLLDASDLAFVDAAGAATIVRFAASRPARPTVVRCAGSVRQVLRLVGADSVPSLVLRDQNSGV